MALSYLDSDMFAPDIIETARALVEQCRARGLRIVTAESCTGGLIAGALTAIPGSSDVVDRGFVTYSNEAKAEMLGVTMALIEAHGAVSAEVAHAMAHGALLHARAELAVAVTGVAGPGGGTAAKPVGLVHIVADRRDGARLHEECRFGDIGRDEVREAAVRSALSLMARAVGPDKLLGLTSVNFDLLVARLEELADQALQERLWLGKIPGEMSSFEEAVCGAFDDSGLSDVLNSPSPRKRDLVSDEVRQSADRLSRCIREAPTRDPAILVQHPAMDAVRSAAFDLLRILQGQTG